ncbi:MAG: putative lipid II flippase FtsW [Chloroflexi bacterium]|nr:putative lipid II flippase FtsW [Chloroflexota bacterium]OJV94592.1 MAG: cell division protein FtsW [Chloroflexi bacterium 54-19]
MANLVKLKKPGWQSFGFDGSRIQNLRSRIGRPDYWLIAIIGLLLVLGTVMVYSSSFVTAEYYGQSPSYYLFRHLLWLGVGLVGCVVASLVDYHKLRQFATGLMIVAMGLLFAVLVLPAQFAPARNDAKRWLTPTGSEDFQFQPSEVAKVILILYAAHWLSSKGEKVGNFWVGVIPFAITIGAMIGLVMGEPDLGTSLVIGCIGLAMFFIAGANIMHMLVGFAAAGGAFTLLAFGASYRLSRLKAYTDPFADPTGLGYHTTGNLMALGSGGLFGAGLGNGRQKFLWLPNAYTDSIFAVLGEELGLVGATLVLVLFLGLAWRGAKIARHAPDGFGRLIAAGTTVYVVSQALINIAVISNLIPFTGIPLPLISYGGTSLAVTMTGLGLLLNVSRQQVADPEAVMNEEKRAEERRKREFAREQRMADRERAAAQRKLHEAETAGDSRLSEKERFDLLGAFRRWQDQRDLPKSEKLEPQAFTMQAPEVPLGRIQKVERVIEVEEVEPEISELPSRSLPVGRQSELMQKRRAELQKTMASWREEKTKDAHWKQAQEAARTKLRTSGATPARPAPIVPPQVDIIEAEVIELEETAIVPVQREENLPAVATESYLSFKTGVGPVAKGDGNSGEFKKPQLQKPRRDWAKMYEARRNRRD